MPDSKMYICHWILKVCGSAAGFGFWVGFEDVDRARRASRLRRGSGTPRRPANGMEFLRILQPEDPYSETLLGNHVWGPLGG